jgi:hypothetical protein
MILHFSRPDHMSIVVEYSQIPAEKPMFRRQIYLLFQTTFSLLLQLLCLTLVLFPLETQKMGPLMNIP